MENKITLKDITDDMKSVFLVTKIYEVNDYYIENKETEFEKIIVNDNIFQIISDINFVYSKESENINEVHKVGLLRNFEVFLDPNKKSDTIIFMNSENKTAELQVIL